MYIFISVFFYVEWKVCFTSQGYIVTINVKLTFHLGGKSFEKNRLEDIRKKRGINQQELATALEDTRQTIGSLENGRYNQSIMLVFKLAKYLGIPVEDISIFEVDILL